MLCMHTAPAAQLQNCTRPGQAFPFQRYSDSLSRRCTFVYQQLSLCGLSSWELQLSPGDIVPLGACSGSPFPVPRGVGGLGGWGIWLKPPAAGVTVLTRPSKDGALQSVTKISHTPVHRNLDFGHVEHLPPVNYAMSSSFLDTFQLSLKAVNATCSCSISRCGAAPQFARSVQPPLMLLDIGNTRTAVGRNR